MSSQNYWFLIYKNAYSSVLLLGIYSLAGSTQSLLVPFISKESIFVPILYIGFFFFLRNKHTYVQRRGKGVLVGSNEKKKKNQNRNPKFWKRISEKTKTNRGKINPELHKYV